MSESDTTRYLVTDARGQFIIEVPSFWQVTFGAVNPGGAMGGRDLHCLRVWEGAGTSKRLRAVFCDVRGIRDLALPLARKVERESGSATWTADSAGNFDRQTRREVEAGFVEEGTDAPF